MKKNLNQVRFQGRVYSHTLEVRKVTNENSKNYGNDYIRGVLNVATDDNCLNVVQINYTYVAPAYNSGAANGTFTALKRIIDENKTVTEVGVSEAMKVSIDSSVAVNDFMAQDGTMVAQKRVEGGFVRIITELSEKETERNQFKIDVIINSVVRRDENPERGIKENAVLRGVAFNFRNELVPCDFVVYNEGAIQYFEDMEVSGSNLLYTQLIGHLDYKSESVEVEVEGAWGNIVETQTRRVRDWVVDQSLKVPYDFDDERTITAEELQKALQDRDTHLAEVKADAEARKAKPAPASATASFTAKPSKFEF